MLPLEKFLWSFFHNLGDQVFGHQDHRECHLFQQRLQNDNQLILPEKEPGNMMKKKNQK